MTFRPFSLGTPSDVTNFSAMEVDGRCLKLSLFLLLTRNRGSVARSYGEPCTDTAPGKAPRHKRDGMKLITTLLIIITKKKRYLPPSQVIESDTSTLKWEGRGREKNKN